MRKLIDWFDTHILKIGVGFLLFFIPLWPKLPLIGIPHTWVYIRLEDIFLSLVVLIWLVLLLRRKVTLATPLTLPIFVYWLVGGVSLASSLLFIAPHLANFFPQVAFFHWLRRIEYIIVFFIAFSTVKSLKDVYYYLVILVITIMGVVLYGFGQKFLGLPAFLTMNEEFAKGIPLYLPPEARMTSTFAGHYDLAAFLLFSLAFLGSLILGLKKWWSKIFLLLVSCGAYILLLFTASRISFMVYLLTISFMLFLQKKKWLILPIIIISLLVMRGVSGTSLRFEKTFRVQQVVYDVRTGKPIATLEEFESKPKASLPPTAVTPPPTPYEELPLGSEFLDVPLIEKLGPKATPTPRPIKTKGLFAATESSQLATISGEFLIKRAIVYDISFTTRFQGEWPRALAAFKRNILLGSGYSSISLATDNDYLRALGETGILGLVSFLAIFLTFLLILRQSLVKISNPFPRAVLIGVFSGLSGLLANAFLIDVFEASKVAYVLWMMIGIAVAVYCLEIRKKESLLKEAYKFLQEPLTGVGILFLLAFCIFVGAIGNYFTGDDFTWLRWAAKTRIEDLGQFFLNAHGFFYRPLIKNLFYFFHLFLGLRPQGYHFISFAVHLLSSLLVYLTIRFLTKNWFIPLLGGILFLIHPIHAETVLWVSGYSGLLAGFFYLASFYAFIRWLEEQGKTKRLFYFGSFIFFALGLLSYEMAVTLPLVLLAYLIVFKSRNWLKSASVTGPHFVLVGIYFYLRNVVAQAHWLSGDYSYNIKNFIFNFFGNLLGYFGEMVVSFNFIALYDNLRLYLRSNKTIGFLLVTLATVLIIVFFQLIRKRKISLEKLVVFSLGWFVITLLPVIGLGNISERYLYIPSFGFILLVVSLTNSLCRRRTMVKLGLIAIIISAVLWFYYVEMERAKRSWAEAGEISNKILRTLSTTYRGFPEGSTLYFVNLPLRVERAWVFPVGIDDGLWFIYRDETLKFMKGNDLIEALDYKEKNNYVWVFIYDNGQLKEATRP